ncbi:alpha-hydroxy acid oxidase [Luteibacter sp. PPL201]|uniref:Alpha-hydroxy acid oxidase n=1 Tax=Luteibacter sahnii TaxID=3021977 RepID=A0ABT6BE90_9GAMM
MNAIACIDDLRRVARSRLPRVLYDYVHGGSWTESACRANVEDFRDVLLLQRVGRDVSSRSTRTRMLGQDASMPVALAPAGLTGLLYPDGEIAAARAARGMGVPFTLSTMSICSIEDIARHVGGDFWFQLYVMRDRAFVRRLVDRARDAGCPVLVLTLDLQAQGIRYRDLHNRLSVPLRITPSTLWDMATRPRWAMRLLRARRRRFGNLLDAHEGDTSMRGLAAWTQAQFDPTLSWEDVAWIRDLWPGKLVLKGITDPADARQAAHLGADGVIVSNHGGRQLDAVPSSIRMLEHVVGEVGSQLEVHLDGGVRDGQDVVRALGLGAKGVFVGRPYLYGLAATGEDGVRQCLELLRRDMDLVMAFCGVCDVTEIDRRVIFGTR